MKHFNESFLAIRGWGWRRKAPFVGGWLRMIAASWSNAGNTEPRPIKAYGFEDFARTFDQRNDARTSSGAFRHKCWPDQALEKKERSRGRGRYLQREESGLPKTRKNVGKKMYKTSFSSSPRVIAFGFAEKKRVDGCFMHHTRSMNEPV
jgi:hypothetical protein